MNKAKVEGYYLLSDHRLDGFLMKTATYNVTAIPDAVPVDVDTDQVQAIWPTR